MLSDTDRIRNLLGGYCELIDAGDFGGLGAMFSSGSLCDERGRPFATGAAAVTSWFEAGTALYDGTPRTTHVVTGTVIDDAAADGTVEARSKYVVLQAVDGFDLRPIVSGRYRDTFARDASGAWQFAERRYVMDLIGDLSHHWAGPSILREKSDPPGS